jgi:hypothetical protein
MKKFASILAVAAVAVAGGILVVAAAPQDPPKEESKTEKQIRALTEKVEKLEKRVADLEKKLTEKSAGSFEEKLKGILDQFGGGDWQEKLDEFRRQMPEMPEMPDFESMPDFFGGFDFENLDMDQLLEMLKGQFEGQMPELFEGLDLDGLFDQFKDRLAPKGEPNPGEKKAPKRRSI